MSQFQVAYLPIGVPTFHMESAQAAFEKSAELLRSLSSGCVCPDKMLLSTPDLEAFLDTLSPDLIILQNVTFANAAYASAVVNRFSCPVLLWTLREPVIDGGRLRLNSLTGAYSAANAMHAFGRMCFEYVYGASQEPQAAQKIARVIRAAELCHSLKTLRMAAIGHTPQGFGFGRALDAELLKTFGVTLESIEARELIQRAEGYTKEECAPFLREALETMTGLSQTPEKNVQDFARLYKAYADYVTENHIGALASRCWPDFFTAYGTPVCAVLAMLNDRQIASSCESDIYGALSMYIGAHLSGTPAFFGDPVSLNEEENTITYWHCGMAACTLAREDTGAQVGVHPNRRIGPTMDFGCKAGEHVTVFRIGRKPDGAFRLFILEGKALDKPKQFCGASVVVQTGGNARQAVCNSVQDGWEPHFAVVYSAVKEELQILAHMLGLEVCLY